MTDRTLIDQSKDAFTVAEAWHALALPGTPARCCRIPWAEKDRRPSFSVFQDGRRWFNHRDGTGGDVLDFVKEATGMSTADAVRWCAARAGLRGGDDAPDAQPRLRPSPRRQMPERAPEAWPTLRPGTAADKKALVSIERTSDIPSTSNLTNSTGTTGRMCMV